MPEINFRAAEARDIPAILETLRAALGESPLLRRTPELWEWKHFLNPFGDSLVLVAEVDDRIAGVRAMMRWQMLTRTGETLRCLRPVDTATHPAFLRRGIFKALTMSAMELARADGVHLVFNTPNEKSAPGYLRMGWRQVSRIGVLARPRLGNALPPVSGEPPSISRLAPKAGPVPVDELVHHRAPRALRTPRSTSYLSWRFRSHPTASYGWIQGEGPGSGLVARAGSRQSRTELVVSDLLGEPGSSVVHRTAKESKARYLAGWFSKSAPERLTAVRGGMLPVPGVRPLRLVAHPLVDLDFDVFDLASWDLSTSDLELL